ncbi:MAG: pyrroline-5-carboxylate reductase [Pseudorhodoferax sp.]
MTGGGRIGFVGGGNMAGAILGGLLEGGWPRGDVVVVEPDAGARGRLRDGLGLAADAAASPALAACGAIVWAVKPQQLRAAATAAAPYIGQALQVSIAAGIPCEALARWTGAQRVVRAMPNTPALVGQGMTGLYAAPGVGAGDRELVERLLGTTGRVAWVASECDIDAVTALSGSGPAYVFYFMEALVRAGAAMGLAEAEARTLVAQTFRGAAAMVQASDEPLALLRQRVTSPGGTTAAALERFDAAGLADAIAGGAQAARHRAGELARELAAADQPPR